jgi:hypothetical protein
MEIHTLPPGTKNMIVSLRSVNAHHFETAVKREIREGGIEKLSLHLMFNTWMGMVHYYLQNSEWFAPGMMKNLPAWTSCFETQPSGGRKAWATTIRHDMKTCTQKSNFGTV